jgi:nucleotide-binding universal stress UspA family protein
MPSARGRIVVGVDGSEASAAAVRWAAREGRLRSASVHLLFVHDSGRSERAPYAGTSDGPRPDDDNAAGRAWLAAVEQQANRTLPPGWLSSEWSTVHRPGR